VQHGDGRLSVDGDPRRLPARGDRLGFGFGLGALAAVQSFLVDE
jgi:hypothetical protein